MEAFVLFRGGAVAHFITQARNSPRDTLCSSGFPVGLLNWPLATVGLAAGLHSKELSL